MIKQKTAVTIGDSIKYFLASKKARGITEKTIHNYSQSISFFLRDMGLNDSSLISLVNDSTIIGWVKMMRDKGMKVTTINHYLTDVRTFLYFCMEENYLKPFKINLMKGQAEAPKFYNDEEISVLLKKPSSKDTFTNYRTWIVICFILATGARASTLVNIRLSDISFSNGEVRYRHLKNKTVATVPLSSSLSKVLREYLNTWSREKEDGYLFCDMSENQCTVSSLYQSMEHYCKSRGVEHKGLHALRHSFSRLYILNGGDAFSLQRILTHKSITMTNRYVHLFADDLKKNYESFAPLDNLTVSRQSTIHRK